MRHKLINEYVPLRYSQSSLTTSPSEPRREMYKFPQNFRHLNLFSLYPQYLQF